MSRRKSVLCLSEADSHIEPRTTVQPPNSPLAGAPAYQEHVMVTYEKLKVAD